METNFLPSDLQLPQRSPRIERHIQTSVPFHHLSVSNLPPTELELSEIQSSILPALDEDIWAVDSAVSAARGRVKFLERERDALKYIEHNLGNIISTRRRIPPEIWSEIFLYGDFLDSSNRKDEFNWPSRTIWQLSQVCQTWRNLALSLHSCWSSIVLDFSSGSLAPEKDLELLSLVLERSHQHLLNITLLHHGNENLPVSLCRMRDKVFAESHRWRTARLVDYHQVRPDLLYAPLRGRLPQLELLDFQCVGGMDSGQAVISAFKECPRLVEVALTGADPRLVELPRQQITCLRLLDRLPYWCVEDFQVYVHLISQCPLLEVLRVDFTKCDHGPLLQSLTLPRVRNLSVTYPCFLDSLVLPRLEVAALDEKLSTFNPDTLYSFRSFIQRSNCASNLVNLRITGVSLALHHSEPHLLLSVLTQTTKLATLQLEASMFDRRLNAHDVWRITQIMDVMRALKVVPGQTVNFLPRLVSLDIKVFGHTDADYVPYLRPFDEFVCMLKARRAGNQDCKLGQFRFLLRTIHVDYTAATYGHRPVFNEDESSVLCGLAEDGMSLDIRFEGFLSFHL